jgi:hypothetical protein
LLPAKRSQPEQYIFRFYDHSPFKVKKYLIS